MNTPNSSAINLYWGFPITVEYPSSRDLVGNRDIPADKNSTEYDNLNFNVFSATSYDTLKEKVKIAVENNTFTPDMIAMSEFLRTLYPTEFPSFRLESELPSGDKEKELIYQSS